LQNITPKLLAVARFDWYDPNKKVKGTEISTNKGLSMADIRYNTVGIGAVYFVNAHVKCTVYYSMVHNEATAISGYEKDVKDNIFTCRLQYRF
jgi:phosphate-selective porin